jgi:aminopeptidase N
MQVETAWRMNEQYVTRVVQYAFAADALLSSHPMTQSVDSPDSIRSIFDTISYEKGNYVIRL